MKVRLKLKNKRKIKIWHRIAIAAALVLVLCGCTGLVENAKNNNSQQANQNITANVPQSAENAVNASFTIGVKSLSIKKGDVYFLNEKADPQLANKIEWSSSDSTIAAVDDGGRIDGVETGVAVITARIDNSAAKVTVTVAPPEATSVQEQNTTAVSANSETLAKNLQSIESGGASKQPYYIKVNRAQNCVTVYTFDEDGDYTIPVRAMVCSVGTDNGTIVGKFEIYCKYRWLALFGDVYGQYATGFSGNYLFHSVPYAQADPATLKAEAYNKLGSAASMGCVRLAVADAKWIYDNCEYETVVDIFDDEDFDGPLGKPQPIKIPLNSGYDPTDDTKNNPFANQMPKITGAQDANFSLNYTPNLLAGVSAVDSCGNDITVKIEVLGNVNPQKAGVYKITYRVTDVLGKKAEVDRFITVSS
jgi:lipoprotein-anchoring transpeptidase ErfK/SrfK